ncbi:MAG: cupin domain-containing protein, partial [Bacteroidota bacterium]
LFLVIEGKLLMELEDQTLEIHPGEFVIIPRGVMHKPIAPQEVKVLLFEPATTLNTGDQVNERTVSKLEKL